MSITEEESGEAEAATAPGEAAEGSEGEEPPEESDESTDSAPSPPPDQLPLLSHALRRLHQLQPPDDWGAEDWATERLSAPDALHWT